MEKKNTPVGYVGDRNRPVISVCIANYNGEKFIEECLNSVIEQVFDLPVEVIVHDDASADNSVNLIREGYPEIRLIVSTVNVGYCVSNNRMVDASVGRYVLLLNNDAQLYPDALSTLYEIAERSGGQSILSLPQYSQETGELIDRGNHVDIFMNPVPNQSKEEENVAMVIGACLWLPRALWDQLGGFPEWFESVAEDLYLCTIARLRNSEVKVADRSGYIHRYGTSFGGGKAVSNTLNTTVKRRRLSERNKTFTLIITYPACWLLLALPAHVTALLIEGGILSLLKWNSGLWTHIYWNCLMETWRARAQLRKCRREQQRCRLASAAQFFSTTRLIPRKLVLLWQFGVPRIR